MRSREPVEVKFVGGSVDADGLEVNDHGKVLTFTGRVRTVFQAGAEWPAREEHVQADERAPPTVAKNTLPPPRAATPPTASLRQ